MEANGKGRNKNYETEERLGYQKQRESRREESQAERKRKAVPTSSDNPARASFSAIKTR